MKRIASVIIKLLTTLMQQSWSVFPYANKTLSVYFRKLLWSNHLYTYHTLSRLRLCHVYFISFSIVSLWFWFIQTLFAGQTLHKVNNPTVWITLSIVMYLLTPFVFVSMKVLYHKTRQENQTFSLSGERKTNPSWENMIEISIVFFPDSNVIKWRTNRDICWSDSQIFLLRKVSTVLMCLFAEDKQCHKVCTDLPNRSLFHQWNRFGEI